MARTQRFVTWLLLAALAGGGATTAFAAPPDTPPPDVALVGATLVDGRGGAPVEDAVVVLRDGRILCAGARADCAIPEGVETMDVAGAWITPGLIDAHVHFSQTGWADGRPDALDLRDTYPYEQTIAELRDDPQRWYRCYLCSGVTAVFDVGGYAWTVALQDRAELDTRAPHVAAAGPLLSTIDHWLNLEAERQFIHLESEESARRGVAYLKSLGSAAVKSWFIVRPGDDLDTLSHLLAVAGEEAKKTGLPLIVHATELEGAKAALRAGAKVLVHSVWDAEIDQEFIDLARRNGTIYCPTLTVSDGYARMFESVRTGRPPVIDDPNRCVDAKTRERVASTATLGADKAPPADSARDARARERAHWMAVNLVKVRDAGIPIAMGTDAGNPLTLHGVSVHAEMEAMQSAGMTPMEVVVAATRVGAQAMGRGADLGTLEPGKIADLLVLNADPTADVVHFRELRYVVRGGVVRAQSELTAPE